jgi:hypothetical protein
MFIVANGRDLTSLGIVIEANDAEAGEPDKCGGGTFFKGHDVLLWLSGNAFRVE